MGLETFRGRPPEERALSVGVDHNHQAEVVLASVSCFGIILAVNWSVSELIYIRIDSWTIVLYLGL